MRTAFQPKGEISKRQILYNAVCDAPLGKVFSYQELDNLTGLDICRKERGTIYGTNKWLLKRNNKTLVNRRDVGYEMAQPLDQLLQAASRPKRARRQLTVGILEAQNMDVSKLSPDERVRQVNLINHIALSLRAVRKRNIETAESAHHTKQNADKTTKAIDDVLARLNALEQKVST